MQISRTFLAACASSLFFLPLTMIGSEGKDTETQAKAREALRQKMSELQGQTPSNSTSQLIYPGGLSAPNASEEEVKKEVAARAKAREQAEKTAKAEAAARRKEDAKRKAELDAQAKADSRLKAEQEAQAKAQAQKEAAAHKEATTQKQVAAQNPAPAKTTAPPPAQAQVKPVQPKPASPPATAASAPQPAAKPPVAKAPPAFQPLPAPPVNLAGDKQQRLAELLRKYQADEITPEQYHTERAKIMGER